MHSSPPSGLALQTLGLSATAATVYRQVLAAGRATGAALARTTGATPDDIETALMALERAGLVVLTDEQPSVAIALPPRIAVDAALARTRGHFESELALAKLALEEMAADHREPIHAQPALEPVGFPETVAAILADAGTLAGRDVRSLGLLTMPNAELASPRVVCDASELHLVGASRAAGLCQTVRVVPALSLRMLLVGDRLAVVLMADGARALVVREPSLVAALSLAWDAIWQQALPAPGEPAEESWPLLPMECRLLELMAAGIKDEVAATRLGISKRSLTRHAAAVLGKLGANNRFQAGYLLARRGWLERSA